MKYLYFLLLSTVLSPFSGCEKVTCREPGNLDGYWELRKVEGAYTVAGTSEDVPPGNGRIYYFEGNRFKFYVDFLEASSGTYRLESGPYECEQISPSRLIFLTDGGEYLEPVALKENEFTLFQGCRMIDQGDRTFRRIGKPDQLK